MSDQKTALVVFAREPQEGKVKTRLSRQLPSALVLELYQAMVIDTVKMSQRVVCDQKFIYYESAGAPIEFLRQFEDDFPLRPQSGDDLGERMLRAFADCRKNGFERTVIIGADCPDLGPSDIQKAFDVLSRVDCVLGPAKDGGYYLIGMKGPNPRVFANVTWGTASVLSRTLDNTRRSNISMFLLDEKNDLDTVADLTEFSQKSAGKDAAPKTQEILRRHGEHWQVNSSGAR